MTISTDFLNSLAKADVHSEQPLTVVWPMPGNAGALVPFANFAEWSSIVLDLALRRRVPDIVATKFERSLKLQLLGWIDYELAMVAELVAMTALELALKDCYLGQERARRLKEVNEQAQLAGRSATRKEMRGIENISFADLLAFMVKEDGLTDEQIPLNQRCGGGKVIGFLTGEHKPSLAERRNGMAHGDPYGSSGVGSPCAGLLELVRDLIDYAYRDRDYV
jgi:hypothetical protein